VTPDDPIPRELLRELLVDSVPGADSEAVLYGNRLEAAMLSSTCLALLSPCGPIGEQLQLSILQRTQPDAPSPFIVRPLSIPTHTCRELVQATSRAVGPLSHTCRKPS
jgi:hypothetical protein